ncbi:hypothetical protein [Pseudohoeflea coraliihabitans]|uniref:Uncharacterized protein n=1 Tax=Pseudohoeflea coraliihabitans TaxID=2860393 RepID=A0ABS6WPX5_9HYPH|nr:hypothetical protein [Pseudohoeflea sp. DP4N28-3]MBW3097125.1 hypothetical protein [Pseudohoeflea sp. DP4N28-3]
MPLGNRCDPSGALHATPARGEWTGNRGSIHDPVTRSRLGRRWSTHAWICCSLSYKGQRRDVWGRNGGPGSAGAGWSELFFLDEVTALAAGHRPCFLCRRAAALDFQSGWQSGLMGGRAATPVRAPEMDAVLHRERWQSRRAAPEILSTDALADLPDGTVVAAGSRWLALREGAARAWSFSGYGAPEALNDRAAGFDLPLRLVTPRAIIEVLRAGYQPGWHSSAA